MAEPLVPLQNGNSSDNFMVIGFENFGRDRPESRLGLSDGLDPLPVGSRSLQ